jgi:hypothetical protein
MTKILYDINNSFLKNFNKLPHSITPCESKEEFQIQYQQSLGSNESTNAFNIIYVWTTTEKIQRLRGESNIFYIGKTSQSFYQRHFGYSKVESEKWNWERYKHILNNFGDISFFYKSLDLDKKKLEEIEKSLIWSYFEKHLEYPPFNARN